MFTFPSHVALTRASSVDLGDRLPGYIFKNERYIVGDPGNTCTEQVGHKASVVEDAVRSAIKKAKKPEGATGLAVKMLYGLVKMPPTVLQSLEPVSIELSEEGAARIAAEDLFNGPWTHNFKGCEINS